MFKFDGLDTTYKMIRNQVRNILQEKENLTKSETEQACNDDNNQGIKMQIEARLQSVLYLFNTMEGDQHSPTGAGDLATGPYAPHLTRATHTLLTNMYNDMVNGTLPVSVAQIPELFILPDNDFQKWGNGLLSESWFIPSLEKEFLGLSNEAFRYYHFLWYAYFNNIEKFNLFGVKFKQKISCRHNPN